jgi:hypothetical protein
VIWAARSKRRERIPAQHLQMEKERSHMQKSTKFANKNKRCTNRNEFLKVVINDYPRSLHENEPYYVM